MIKKIIVATGLLFSLVGFAQLSTVSPYSYFGIGSVRPTGTIEMQSMGGLGVEKDSIHINLDNPASLAALKLTLLNVGGTYSSTKLKNDSQTINKAITTLDYLAVGIPITKKIGVGFGLQPYSTVGYKTESIAQDATQNSRKSEGKGGLNKVFLGTGYEINSKWAVGANIQYNFGKISVTNLDFNSDIPVGTLRTNSIELSGFNFNIGTMYQTKFNEKLRLHGALNYTIESPLNSANTASLATARYDSNFNTSVVDQATDVVTETRLRLPNVVTLGLGIGETKKWLLGTQIKLGTTPSLNNSYNTLDNVYFSGYQGYSLGGYYIPNYRFFSNYLKKIVYRGGLKFEKTGLVVNSQSINDVGLTLGVGLPITGSFSNINLNLAFGSRGTTSSKLVREDYINFSLSCSLNDKWFEKKKFN